MTQSEDTDITLYGYFRSSTSFRVRMALALKGLDYRSISVNLLEKEHQGEAYRAVNPQGLVPSLVHQGKTLTQSMAILEYLDETFPQDAIIYGDAYSRARIRAMSQLIACDIHPMNNLNVWKGYVGGVLGADEQALSQWYEHWIVKGLSAYEAMLADDNDDKKEWRFSCGDTPSMADICLLPQLYNARRFKVRLDDFPRILKIEAEMLKLEAVQQALPERQSDAPQDMQAIYG